MAEVEGREDRSRGAAGNLLGWIAAIGVVLGVVVAVRLSLVRAFHPDEMQHLHIAWSIAHGQLLYRDFFEHHGPLYSLLNGWGLAAVRPRADPDLTFAFRALSLGWMALTLGVTGALTRALGGGRWAGMTVAAALCAIPDFVHRGLEMRPDGLQAALWMAGILLLRRYEQARYAAAAGLLLSLCALTNAKALGGIGALGAVFLAMELRRVGPRVVLRGLGLLCLGGAVPVVVVGGWFAARGALWDLVYYTLLFNLEYSGSQDLSAANPRTFVADLVDDSPLIVLMCTLGTIEFARMVVRAGASVQRSLAGAVLVATPVMAVLGWLTSMYAQYYLSVLPLALVIGVVGLQVMGGRNHEGWWILCLTVGVSLGSGVGLRRLDPADRTVEQRRLTQQIIDSVPRSEPVVTLWNDCAGYMFNADLQFHWMRQGSMFEGGVFDDELEFGAPFVERLQAARVTYVVATPEEVAELPEGTAAFLRQAYRREHRCLLIRREQGADGAR